MFGRTNHTPDTRYKDWQAFAERLELEDASDQERRLRVFLNLESRCVLSPIYRVKFLALPEGLKANLYFLDYETSSGPKSAVSKLSSVCLLSVPHEISAVSLKASRKLNKVLESLGASASGGSVVTFPEDTTFSERVTVYARDVDAARNLLSQAVRRTLKKALYGRGLAPTFLLGERQLLFSYTAAKSEASPLEALERLSSDLLSLYALFSVTHKR